MCCGHLKLDDTEDDDDVEDDEVAQNKLVIVVAEIVKTGTCAATCLREEKYVERSCEATESHRSCLSKLRLRWQSICGIVIA